MNRFTMDGIIENGISSYLRNYNSVFKNLFPLNAILPSPAIQAFKEIELSKRIFSQYHSAIIPQYPTKQQFKEIEHLRCNQFGLNFPAIIIQNPLSQYFKEIEYLNNIHIWRQLKCFEIIEILEKTNWLPYNSEICELAYEYVNDPQLFNEMIFQYYNLNWNVIKQEFLSRLDDYDIDEDAKETSRKH